MDYEISAKVVKISQSNKKWRQLLSTFYLFHLLFSPCSQDWGKKIDSCIEGRGTFTFRRTAAVEIWGEDYVGRPPIWSDFSAFEQLCSNKGTTAGTSWSTPRFSSVLSNDLLILANNFSNQQWMHPLIALWRDCEVCEGWIVVARRWVEASIRNRLRFSNLGQREAAADR